MAHPVGSSDRSSLDRSNFERKPNNMQRVVGVALMLVGGVFSVYGASAGVSKLITISTNHFGTLCLAGVINFIFWTIVVFPVGGFIANGVCMAGGGLMFGGLPAAPGAVVAFAGFLLYVNA